MGATPHSHCRLSLLWRVGRGGHLPSHPEDGSSLQPPPTPQTKFSFCLLFHRPPPPLEWARRTRLRTQPSRRCVERPSNGVTGLWKTTPDSPRKPPPHPGLGVMPLSGQPGGGGYFFFQHLQLSQKLKSVFHHQIIHPEVLLFETSKGHCVQRKFQTKTPRVQHFLISLFQGFQKRQFLKVNDILECSFHHFMLEFLHPLLQGWKGTSFRRSHRVGSLLGWG